MNAPLRIAVFGPESTGKTTLAAKLAAHFSAPLVTEYAREFWDAEGAITLEDIPKIAREQWRREDKACADAVQHPPSAEGVPVLPDRATFCSNPLREGQDTSLIICDTEALTTVLWSDLLYGTCPEDIRRGAEARAKNYSLYLLLDIDVPWAADPQRCFPREEDRQMCMKLWRGALERRGLPHVWIHGNWAERERAAMAAVDALLGKG